MNEDPKRMKDEAEKGLNINYLKMKKVNGQNIEGTHHQRIARTDGENSIMLKILYILCLNSEFHSKIEFVFLQTGCKVFDLIFYTEIVG